MTRSFLFFSLITAIYPIVFAQGEAKVEVIARLSDTGDIATCRELELGNPVQTVEPVYPGEAKSRGIGGIVSVQVRVSKDGKIAHIIKVTGDEALNKAVLAPAAATRFTPSLCDSAPIEVNGLLIFRFVPFAIPDTYMVPERTVEFRDIDPGSPYYESILTLTENYRIAFGYADGKFHTDAPLTKGDFAQFLRSTLDLLQKRAEVAGKVPLEIELHFPLNPRKLKSSGDITDLDPKKPYSRSVGLLISDYDIALINEKQEFRGDSPMTYAQVIEYWKTIFGKDAVPVNFEESTQDDRVVTRGEFALFLHESLFVLTYKILP